MVLGDNIIEGSIADAVRDFEQQERGAKILLKEVQDAERFGVAEINGDRIAGIEEKPEHPKSNFAVTGIYMYDETVFDKTRTLKPSARGELEITDVNNAYISEGTMTFNLSGGLVDGRGHVRFAAASEQSSTRDAPQTKPRAHSSGGRINDGRNGSTNQFGNARNPALRLTYQRRSRALAR